MKFRYIAFFITAFLQLGILAGSIHFSRPWFTDDSLGYLNLARSILEGRGFGKVCEFGFLNEPSRLPGYPGFVSGLFWLFGADNLVIVIAQAIMVIVSTFLTYSIASEIFGSRTGYCFLGLSIIYPFIANASSFISPEVAALFLLTLAIYLLRSGEIVPIIFSASCFALAAYMRPNLILLGPAVAVACFAFCRKENRQRYLLIPLVIAILFAPWAYRNYQVHGKPTPTAVVGGLGVSIFVASWESRIPTRTLMNFGKGQVSAEATQSGIVDQMRLISSKVKECCPNEDEKVILSVATCESVAKQSTVDREMLHLGIGNIAEQPLQYISNVFANVFRMWFTYFALDSFSWPVRWALLLNGIGVFVLGSVGIFMSLRRFDGFRCSPVYIASLVAVLYVPATQAWLNTQARYTIPVRMLMLMLAAFALAQFLEVTRGYVNERQGRIGRFVS